MDGTKQQVDELEELYENGELTDKQYRELLECLGIVDKNANTLGKPKNKCEKPKINNEVKQEKDNTKDKPKNSDKRNKDEFIR